jgi:hypothetical protein
MDGSGRDITAPTFCGDTEESHEYPQSGSGCLIRH